MRPPCEVFRQQLQDALDQLPVRLAGDHTEHFEAAASQLPRFARPDSPDQQLQGVVRGRAEQLLRKLLTGVHCAPEQPGPQTGQILVLHE